MNLEKIKAELSKKPLPVVTPEAKPAGAGKPWEVIKSEAESKHLDSVKAFEVADDVSSLFTATVTRLFWHYVRVRGFSFFSAKQVSLFRHVEKHYEELLTDTTICGHFTAYLAKPDNWLPIISELVKPYGFIPGEGKTGLYWTCRKSSKAEVNIPV